MSIFKESFDLKIQNTLNTRQNLMGKENRTSQELTFLNSNTSWVSLKSSINVNNNYDLAKIFEYYSCIKLSEEFNQEFYEYSDIEPNFKEMHNLSKNDTGIDACNLLDTIVQCKLRDETLSWKECSTFFGSNVILNNNKLDIKWNKMIKTRNKNSKLSNNLKNKQ